MYDVLTSYLRQCHKYLGNVVRPARNFREVCTPMPTPMSQHPCHAAKPSISVSFTRNPCDICKTAVRHSFRRTGVHVKTQSPGRRVLFRLINLALWCHISSVDKNRSLNSNTCISRRKYHLFTFFFSFVRGTYQRKTPLYFLLGTRSRILHESTHLVRT